MKYSIIIPTYNNLEKFLIPCIDSIIKYTNPNDIEIIVVANGCTDNTIPYLGYIQNTSPINIKFSAVHDAVGYPKAINMGIRMAQGEKIILLNNDCVLLEQEKNLWINMLNGPFEANAECGISCIIRNFSDCINSDFAVFFCVMISKKVFNYIGLLNEEYGIGSGEDMEFSMKAKEAGFEICEVFEKVSNEGIYTGGFPIYHYGEGTVNDTTLVKDWDKVYRNNQIILSKKYNKEYYKYLLSNNYERAVFLEGDTILPRESNRYSWASRNIVGEQILEVGCSTGYGSQFFPKKSKYWGIDYDPVIIEVAAEQNWCGDNVTFSHMDINVLLENHLKSFQPRFENIVAFEIIEHLDNGMEIVEKLKQSCNNLLISVPWNEPKLFWGEHHKLWGLNESNFPGFNFTYVNEKGEISSTPQDINDSNKCNLMLCRWVKS